MIAFVKVANDVAKRNRWVRWFTIGPTLLLHGCNCVAIHVRERTMKNEKDVEGKIIAYVNTFCARPCDDVRAWRVCNDNCDLWERIESFSRNWIQTRKKCGNISAYTHQKSDVKNKVFHINQQEILCSMNIWFTQCFLLVEPFSMHYE
jgi:hypothetical protein